MVRPLPAFLLAAITLFAAPALCEDPVFSGPQVGEKLTPFVVRGVLGELAGKDIDLVESADGNPIVVVFMHQLTRPSAAVARAVLDYAAKQGLVSGLVFLSDDATATEELIKRAAHALPKAPVGISVDGAEGPGAYGLNRNLTLTILVGKSGKVSANFALVQPSVQADVPRIGRQIALVVGKDEQPTLEQMGVPEQYRGQPGRMEQDPNLRRLLGPLINKSATADEVKRAADGIETYAAKNPASRKQIGDIARRIIAAGVLERYGTPSAQKYLEKWAVTFDPVPISGPGGRTETRAKP